MESQSNPRSINVWSYKPWWCQPWSIALTGFGAIAVSWLIFHAVWLTVLVAVPMLSWMAYFLLVYPRAMQPYLQTAAEQPSAPQRD